MLVMNLSLNNKIFYVIFNICYIIFVIKFYFNKSILFEYIVYLNLGNKLKILEVVMKYLNYVSFYICI